MADDLDPLLEIMGAAFNMPEDEREKYRAWVGDENFRAGHVNGALAGGLVLLPKGQFFGGRSVPMTGVGAVAVAPEFRGSGVATKLMRDAVLEMHSKGMALSALYPATEPLYRRAGYEQAGSAIQLRLSLSSIRLRERDLPVRRIEDGDMELVRSIYRRRAVGSPGNLDRIDYNWQEIRHRSSAGYLIGEDGYLFTKVINLPGEPRKELQLVDHAAVTAPAMRRLLTFLADHSSLRRDVLLFVGPSDPLLATVPEQRYMPRYLDHWMLRVVHVPAALEARGYNRGVEADLHLALTDDVVPENAGSWRVAVADGAAHVERGGHGELKLDIRALASLYTGHLSVATLKNAGWIEGPEAALEAAQAAFSGPAPWMSDGF